MRSRRAALLGNRHVCLGSGTSFSVEGVVCGTGMASGGKQSLTEFGQFRNALFNFVLLLEAVRNARVRAYKRLI